MPLRVEAKDRDGDRVTCTAGGTGTAANCNVSSLSSFTGAVSVSDGRGGTASAQLNVTGVNSAPSVACTFQVTLPAGSTANVETRSTDPDSDPLTCAWELIQPSQGVQLWIEGESCDSNGWVRIRSESCAICWGQVHVVARDPWGAASSDCGTRIYGQ